MALHEEPSCPCGNPRRPGGNNCRVCHAAYQRRHRPSYAELTPEQRQRAIARAMANEYQKRGKLLQQPCEWPGCTDPLTVKHHDDYGQPLRVRWFCAWHHREHHKLGRATP